MTLGTIFMVQGAFLNMKIVAMQKLKIVCILEICIYIYLSRLPIRKML
jgi:hypothetical protein